MYILKKKDSLDFHGYPQSPVPTKRHPFILILIVFVILILKIAEREAETETENGRQSSPVPSP